MSESTAKKKTPAKKPDDGKSSVMVRIDRELLGKARAEAKEHNTSLDEVFGISLLNQLKRDPEAVDTAPSDGIELNVGPRADALAFCEKRGWTLSYMINRALIHELERCK